MLDLEHASAVEHAPVTIEGRPVDAILGVGIGWEMPQTYSLDPHLRGEPSGAAAVPAAEQEAIAVRLGGIWAALIQAAGDQPSGA